MPLHMVQVVVEEQVVLAAMVMLPVQDLVEQVFNFQQHLEILYLHLDL
jgi:hypothetical protein